MSAPVGNRFLAFGGESYEESGGMNDFMGYYGSVIDAVNAMSSMLSKNCDVSEFKIKCIWQLKWGHVYDTADGTIVWENGNNCYKKLQQIMDDKPWLQR